MVNPNLEMYKILGTVDMPHIEPVLWTRVKRACVSLGEPPVGANAGAVEVRSSIGDRSAGPAFALTLTTVLCGSGCGKNRKAPHDRFAIAQPRTYQKPQRSPRKALQPALIRPAAWMCSIIEKDCCTGL